MSYNMYEITEFIIDKKPSCHIDNLQEQYNEALLKRTELTMKENKDVKKKFRLKLNQIAFVHR